LKLENKYLPTLLKNDVDSLRLMHRLKTLRVSIALDDPGTRYWSLSYLTMIPFGRITLLALSLQIEAIGPSAPRLFRQSRAGAQLKSRYGRRGPKSNGASTYCALLA
jgi:hypothetical protein